jgi:tRNA dimethylallyltransferase
VPHYLLDLVAPDHNFTLAEYQSHAQRLISHFHDRGIGPLLVGGTGQYIKAIVDGWQIPQVPPQIALRQELSQLGQSYCYQLLQNLDAPACCKIHPHDHHRTLRALEVFYVTGKPLSQLQTHPPPPIPSCRSASALLNPKNISRSSTIVCKPC